MWRSQVNPRRQPKPRRPRPRVVAFEGVEPRQMMSITQLPILITGTSGNDSIEVHFEQINGHTTGWRQTTPASITIADQSVGKVLFGTRKI